jgi:hypothetical protein
VTAFRCFLGSKLGLAATLAVAAVGAYLLWNHSGHVLAAAPYLLLLACPLMHLFGHRHGHSHDQHGSQSQEKRHA